MSTVPTLSSRILGILLLLAFVVGCDNSAAPPSGGSNHTAGIWTLPGVGSQFVYSNGWYSPNDTVVVRTINQTAGGKSNVITFDTLHSTFGVVGYLAYEANDDISIGDSSYNWTYWKNGWIRYVSGSRTTDTTVLQDTTTRTVDGDQREFSFEERSFLGEDTMTVDGHALYTRHVRVMWKNMAIGPTPRWDRTNWSSCDLWLAPSLGFIVKSRIEYVYDGVTTTSYDKMLLSYSLK